MKNFNTYSDNKIGQKDPFFKLAGFSQLLALFALFTVLTSGTIDTISQCNSTDTPTQETSTSSKKSHDKKDNSTKESLNSYNNSSNDKSNYSTNKSSYNTHYRECINGYSSEIVDQSIDENCITTTLKITSNGTSTHGLSHATIGVNCGTVTVVENSEGWDIEKNNTDPTTGIYGFKVDNINNFGEGNTQETFTVTYTICADDAECLDSIATSAFTVAYKYGLCVNYETLTPIISTTLPLEGELLPENLSCYRINDGSIQAIISGGTEPYTFLWSNNDTTSQVSGLAAGAYSLLVTDSVGDTLQLSTTITQPNAIQVSSTLENPTCSNTNGSISVIATEGIGNYTYIWNTTDTTSTLSNIGSGNYLVSITDENSCTATRNIALYEASSPIQITGTVTNSACGDDNGSIDVTLSGTSESYTVLWNTGATTEDLNNVIAGMYQITVSDSTGCSATEQFQVSETSTLIASISSSILECHQDGEGEVAVSPYGGVGPYSYLWSNGDTTQTISNLNAGAYKVRITDNKGCTIEKTAYVSLNRLLATASTISPSCSGDNDASINVNVMNGTEPYSYTWSTGQNTQNLDGISAGWYNVTINDANNCSYSKSVYIADALPININSSITAADCSATTTTASVNLTATGGSAPYLFYIADSIVTSPFSVPNNSSISVTAIDNKGCEATKEIIASATSSNLNIVVDQTNPSCSENNGSATVSVTGGVEPYTVYWPDGTTGATKEQLTPGSYEINVTDLNNCSASTSFTIIENSLDSRISTDINTPEALPGCDSSNNTLSTTSQNAEIITWSIDAADPNWQIISGNRSDTISYSAGSGPATFTATVQRADGCTSSSSYTLECTQQEDPNTGDTTDDGSTDGTTDNGTDTSDGGSTDGTTDDGTDTTNGGSTDGTTDNTDDDSAVTPDSDCGDTPFFHTTSSIIMTSNNCYDIEIEVTTNGNARHELSHMVIGVSEGTISNAYNSEDWPMETNSTDPKSGVYGIKVDNVNNFGHDGYQSFIVSFTVCDISQLPESLPIVYKAGQCVYNETLAVDTSTNTETNVDVSCYPNPFHEKVEIEIESEEDTHLDLSIYNSCGSKLETLHKGDIKGGIKYRYQYNSNSSERLYFYKITTNKCSKQGKFIRGY